MWCGVAGGAAQCTVHAVIMHDDVNVCKGCFLARGIMKSASDERGGGGAWRGTIKERNYACLMRRADRNARTVSASQGPRRQTHGMIKDGNVFHRFE